MKKAILFGAVLIGAAISFVARCDRGYKDDFQNMTGHYSNGSSVQLDPHTGDCWYVAYNDTAAWAIRMERAERDTFVAWRKEWKRRADEGGK